MKVRRVVFAKMRERVETLFWGGGIENDLDQAQETIVFDDEFHIWVVDGVI